MTATNVLFVHNPEMFRLLSLICLLEDIYQITLVTSYFAEYIGIIYFYISTVHIFFKRFIINIISFYSSMTFGYLIKHYTWITTTSLEYVGQMTK